MLYDSITSTARRLSCLPKDISDFFYRGKLDADRCPIIAGRRLIPLDMIPEIAAALAARKRRTPKTEVTAEGVGHV